VEEPQAGAIGVEQALRVLEHLLEDRLERLGAGELRREAPKRVGSGRPDHAERGSCTPFGGLALLEEAIEVAAAKVDLVVRPVAQGRQLPARAPRAHGFAMDAREPGSLSQGDQLGGRTRPRSEGHRAWRSSLSTHRAAVNVRGAGMHPGLAHRTRRSERER
jgi:hypothetical protein